MISDEKPTNINTVIVPRMKSSELTRKSLNNRALG